MYISTSYAMLKAFNMQILIVYVVETLQALEEYNQDTSTRVIKENAVLKPTDVKNEDIVGQIRTNPCFKERRASSIGADTMCKYINNSACIPSSYNEHISDFCALDCTEDSSECLSGYTLNKRFLDYFENLKNTDTEYIPDTCSLEHNVNTPSNNDMCLLNETPFDQTENHYFPTSDNVRDLYCSCESRCDSLYQCPSIFINTSRTEESYINDEKSRKYRETDFEVHNSANIQSISPDIIFENSDIVTKLCPDETSLTYHESNSFLTPEQSNTNNQLISNHNKNSKGNVNVGSKRKLMWCRSSMFESQIKTTRNDGSEGFNVPFFSEHEVIEEEGSKDEKQDNIKFTLLKQKKRRKKQQNFIKRKQKNNIKNRSNKKEHDRCYNENEKTDCISSLLNEKESLKELNTIRDNKSAKNFDIIDTAVESYQIDSNQNRERKLILLSIKNDPNVALKNCGKTFFVYYEFKVFDKLYSSIKNGCIKKPARHTFYLQTKIDKDPVCENKWLSMNISIKNIPIFFVPKFPISPVDCRVKETKHTPKKTSFLRTVNMNIKIPVHKKIKIFNFLPSFVFTTNREFFRLNYTKKINQWLCYSKIEKIHSFNEMLKEQSRIKTIKWPVKKKDDVSSYVKKNYFVSSFLREIENFKEYKLKNKNSSFDISLEIINRLCNLKTHLLDMSNIRNESVFLKSCMVRIYNFQKAFLHEGKRLIEVEGGDDIDKCLNETYNKLYDSFMNASISFIDSYNMFLKDEFDSLFDYYK
ncbi:hypothetical protein CDIK_2342 [Cucumispora dikerogammari]|nr:hypothetical protein CDIK_2342 [Cucumispora dikerogammari]